jgi:hypothetical protein
MHVRDFASACALTITLLPLHAVWAEVGTVSAIEGESVRVTPSGQSLALRVGSQLGLGDMLEVKSGNLKITLTDASEIALAAGSLLRIDEAQFKELEHRRFSGWLFVGSLWSRVTKALSGSGAKFEVVTDRMVAGVRGTTFRVDIVANEGNEKETLVHAIEGRVGVAERAGSNSEPKVRAKLKSTELNAGEGARATKDGMRREQGPPPAREEFERFIHSHQRANESRAEHVRSRERNPRRR